MQGDLTTNWGETPTDMRPLFMLIEEVARIPGSARVFAVIAYRESRFITTAHNGNAADEQDERDDSRLAYANNKGRNPPLRYGSEAAEFGSGGLFGALAPYFLWTGDGAGTLYEESVALGRALLAHDPARLTSRRGLAFSLENLEAPM